MATNIALLENNKQTSQIEKSATVESVPKPIFQSEILIGGVEIIEKIFVEWTDLCEEGASNNPFLRPEWFTAFVKNFELEIMLFTVRQGLKLRAVLPLMKKKGRLHGIPVRKLQAVFNLNTQYFDLIHGADETERKEIVEAIWKEIKKQSKWDILEIRMVRKDTWLNDLLILAESENYRTGIWKMDSAPFITLPQADDKEVLIEQYFKRLSQPHRKKLNRKRYLLKEFGKVELVVTRGYQTELMQKYFDLESQGWKGRGGTAVTDDPKVARLHDDFARAVAAKNALFIYELKLNDKTIAMYISIMYDKQTIGWKTSYNEDYAFYSPGNIVKWEVLCGCMRNNSPEIDLLSPATFNKRYWASGEREQVAFYVFRQGIIGSLFWKWKFSVISYLRRFKKNPEKSN